MKARPDLFFLFPPSFLILLFNNLCVVLDDVGQALAGQHPLPQVIGLDAIGVGRVSRTVIPADVEGQEPRRLTLQVRTELHLMVVHREVSHAATELEELIARIAVLLVLPHCIRYRLLGETVLQLKSRDRQTVDEEPQVESQLGFVAAVAKLACYREAVLLVELIGFLVAR